jgi:hypothetical protein
MVCRTLFGESPGIIKNLLELYIREGKEISELGKRHDYGL